MEKKNEEFCGVYEWLDEGKLIHEYPQTVACPDWETGKPRYGTLYVKSDLQFSYEHDQARTQNNASVHMPDGEVIPLDEITVQRIAFREYGKDEDDSCAPLFAKTLINGIEVFLIDVAYFEGIANFADGTERPVCLIPFSTEPPWECLDRLDDILEAGLYQDTRMPDILGVRPRTN